MRFLTVCVIEYNPNYDEKISCDSEQIFIFLLLEFSIQSEHLTNSDFGFNICALNKQMAFVFN